MNITNGSSVKGIKKDVAFGAHKKVINSTGEQVQKFFLPYDSSKYSATVKIYKLSKDEKTDDLYVSQDDQKMPKAVLSLDKNGNSVEFDPSRTFGTDYNNRDGYAYRFELKDNETGKVSIAYDAGTTTSMLDNSGNNDLSPDNKFNIVLKNGAVLNKEGKMQLEMLDQYNPGYYMGKDGKPIFDQKLRTKALNSVRTHINKMGGNFAGLIANLNTLKKEGYTRIVGLPITKDSVSSHCYWSQNNFQLAPQYGTLNDYKTLQTEMYKRGMNWISDAALVNEGLEGIHFADVLKNGKDSPFYNWFKINTDGPLAMGIIPPESDKFVGYKYVNAPFNADNAKSKNKDYDPSKPTYIQFFDKRLADKTQQTDSNLINTYSENNTSNKYDITSHDDTIYPYSFELTPKDLDKLSDEIDKYKSSHDGANLQSVDAIRDIMQFEHFKIDLKNEGGFVNWDGNVDIAKLNFAYGADDDKKYENLSDDKKLQYRDEKEGSLAVKDYAINSGKYWTKLSADIPLAYTANLLKGTNPDVDSYFDKLDEVAEEIPPTVADVVDEEVVNNVLEGKYKSRILDNKDSAKDSLTRNVMDFPMESLPVGSDVLALLTSPYITKRPSTDEELGVSKFDIYKAGNPNLNPKYKDVSEKADAFYANDVAGFANDILKSLDLDLFDGDNLTNLGKYIVNDSMPDIINFAMLKSLDKDAKLSYQADGSLDLSNIDSANYTMGKLGINELTPKENAVALLSKMATNLKDMNEDDKKQFVEMLNKKYAGSDEASFRMAEMIVDRTESGLGWRIDASKDVGSIDSLRNNEDKFEQTWDKVTDFWKLYTQEVFKINPHAFTTAEITDTPDLFTTQGLSGYDVNRKYHSNIDAETKFLRNTGIAGSANYSYYYSMPVEVYAKGFENAKLEDFNKVNIIKDKNINGWAGNPGFFYQSAIEGILHSYTFVGNHDKPRVLHCLALDMSLFNASQKDLNTTYKKDVQAVLGNHLNKIGINNVKAQSIAMGMRLKEAIVATNVPDSITKALFESIAVLASGNDGKNRTDAFGARPFDIAIEEVFDNAKANGLEIDEKSEKKIKDDLFANIMKPAYEKYYSIYKMLVTLPGDVTDFGGDKVGMSGYETKAKNYYQQNRNTIRWEYLDKNSPMYKEDVAVFNKKMNEILDFRNALPALNNGVPVSLPTTDSKFYSLLRYDDNDSMTVTVYNTSGATKDNKTKMAREDAPIDRIQLSGGSSREGLPGGLKEGTIFRSTNPADKDVKFIVRKHAPVQGEAEEYFLEREDGQPIVVRPDDYNALVLFKA